MVTKARKLTLDDVENQTKLYAQGGTVTVEDLFRKYRPEKGVPLSSEVIRWANQFGQTVDPAEEQQFADYYNNSYGGNSGTFVSEPSAWDKMTVAEKAAYYDANPTMGKLTQSARDLFSMSSLGQLSALTNPIGWGEQSMISRGVDPGYMGSRNQQVEVNSQQPGFNTERVGGLRDTKGDQPGDYGDTNAESISSQSSAGSESGGYGTGDTSGGFGEGQYARGGSVSAYDSSRVDAILNEFM
jgi:hypothetical protein